MLIKSNIENIEERIEKACFRSGRKRSEIVFVGVTKFLPIEMAEEGYKAGLRHFGESRVQEAAAKYKGFKEGKPDAELHFIGPLQRNKAKAAAPLFDCVQSVDRESLAAELAKHAFLRSDPLPILLEFRTGEDSKSGFASLDELFRATDFILGCPSLSIRGLMTIAPNTAEEGPVRQAFRRMAQIRQEMERRFSAGCSWSCLSMGMSNDFETAVEEGSTMLRIGTAIFGESV